MGKEYQTITVEKRGAADWLTLDRPEALNAITVEMVSELSDYFNRLFDDPHTRVVVIRGAGKAFCAGLDMRQMEDLDAAPFSNGYGSQGQFSEVYVRMRRCPQPIISLIHGSACGGGFAFALASDVRIAAESARMNAAAIKIGLSGCDMGITYFLPRIVGASVAAELMLTGRFLNALRALQTGLVSEVVPDIELESCGETMVSEMLNASPMGLRMTKEGLNIAIDAPGLEAVIAMENRNQMMTMASPNFVEGVRAFREKREPSYRPD